MVVYEDIENAIKLIIDPDIFIDIWTLGLIYRIDIQGSRVEIQMTFTTPLCPSGPQLVQEVRDRVLEVHGVEQVEVDVTFTPPWHPSDELKEMMGIL